MRVLVTFAVGAEFAPWRRRHAFAPAGARDLALYLAQIGPAEVAVLLTGIGRRAGEQAMRALAEAMERDTAFEFCISSGLAGALSPHYRVGEVLVPRWLKASGVHGDAMSEGLACDASLVELAAHCGGRIVDAFYTSDRIVVTAAEKAALGRIAGAVEMESIDVIQQASAWGAAAVAVRAVSDAAEEDLPLDFNRTLSDSGKVSGSRVLSELRRRPRALPGLVRFASQSRLASRSLADFLDCYVEALAKQSASPRFEEVAAT